MLTRADKTVEDCLSVLNQVLPLGITHVGFKDVGVDRATLVAANDMIKHVGATSYMEVVSTSTDACLQSARVARDIGVDDFCSRCQVCSNLCPPDAIFSEKQMIRGNIKWYVDFDKCIPYFNDTLGCGICIAECPWSLPGVAPSLTQKMLRRRERKLES